MAKAYEHEVEIKVKVQSLDDLHSKLVKLGFVFDEPVVQKDVIFINILDGWPEFNPNRIALRIREENNKILFTFKRSVANELDKIERETEIGDASKMRDIILFLGFTEISKVNKKRITAEKNDISICLDEVENLGSFIEIEKLTDGKASEKVQQELMDFLNSLGIESSERITQGYDTMMASLISSQNTK
jgi:adenylate cyclase class 2